MSTQTIDLPTIRLLRNNVVPQLETTLQKEIRDEENKAESSKLERIRRQMRNTLTTRRVLISVVILCFTDCIMVIGELILDMHAIKSSNQTVSTSVDQTPKKGTLVEKIAHSFHFTSITILGILMIETMVKIAAFGRKFLNKKFEVFDAFVVFVSFIIDLVLLDGFIKKSVKESAYVLSFLLPWRVVRVVNSMIVALLHREHMKLMLVFKSKQYLAKQIDELSSDLALLQKQLSALKDLCRKEGIEDWRINQTIGAVLTESSRRKNAIASLASISLGGMMKAGNMFLANSNRASKVESSNRKFSEQATSTTELNVTKPEQYYIVDDFSASTSLTPQETYISRSENDINNTPESGYLNLNRNDEAFDTDFKKPFMYSNGSICLNDLKEHDTISKKSPDTLSEISPDVLSKKSRDTLSNRSQKSCHETSDHEKVKHTITCNPSFTFCVTDNSDDTTHCETIPLLCDNNNTKLEGGVRTIGCKFSDNCVNDPIQNLSFGFDNTAKNTKTLHRSCTDIDLKQDNKIVFPSETIKYNQPTNLSTTNNGLTSSSSDQTLYNDEQLMSQQQTRLYRRSKSTSYTPL